MYGRLHSICFCREGHFNVEEHKRRFQITLILYNEYFNSCIILVHKNSFFVFLVYNFNKSLKKIEYGRYGVEPTSGCNRVFRYIYAYTLVYYILCDNAENGSSRYNTSLNVGHVPPSRRESPRNVQGYKTPPPPPILSFWLYAWESIVPLSV